MRRRILMMVLAGAAAYPLLAGAQQKAMPVIGWLGVAGVRRFPSDRLPAGPERDRYEEGRNVAIEYRWAEGHYDRLPPGG